jgi:hypothetical protein
MNVLVRPPGIAPFDSCSIFGLFEEERESEGLGEELLNVDDPEDNREEDEEELDNDDPDDDEPSSDSSSAEAWGDLGSIGVFLLERFFRIWSLRR